MKDILSLDQTVPAEALRAMLADAVRLQRLRIYRQLLSIRCSVLGIGLSAVMLAIPGSSNIARWTPGVLFLAAPIAVRCVELQLERSLADRIAVEKRRKSSKVHNEASGRSAPPR